MYPEGFNTHIKIGGPDRGPVRRVAAQSFRRRRHGRRQAPHAMRARRRDLRREGLSAASGRQAAGARSQYSGRDRRRARSCARSDGLALSSRNVYLSPEQRKIAPLLHQTIQRVRARISRKADGCDDAAVGGAVQARAAGFRVDYVAVRDPDTLKPLSGPVKRARVLVAAYLGKTRLIDNVPMPPARYQSMRRSSRSSSRMPGGIAVGALGKALDVCAARRQPRDSASPGRRGGDGPRRRRARGRARCRNTPCRPLSHPA